MTLAIEPPIDGSTTHTSEERFAKAVEQEARRYHEDACSYKRALARLVRLKDGPHDSMYLREKPKAWQAARELLGLDNPGGF